MQTMSWWWRTSFPNFFPPKVLQRQKKYLGRGMYKPRNANIRYFICPIDNMVKYLEKFPPFGLVQRLPEDDTLKLVEL